MCWLEYCVVETGLDQVFFRVSFAIVVQQFAEVGEDDTAVDHVGERTGGGGPLRDGCVYHVYAQLGFVGVEGWVY